MQKLVEHFTRIQSSLPAAGPGFSALIVEDGATVFELHHGLSCLELKVPLSGDSAYYLASESKQFTAACVLRLVRDGLIGLDDDVSALLPQLGGFSQAFPLRSLLNHTSGIPDYFQFIDCQLGRHEADYFDNDLILRLIARLDSVDFPTSTAYGYSNSNYILLASLVERLCGVALPQFAKATLFGPLGMTRLGFDADRFSIIEHRVTSYEPDASRAYGFRQHLGNANTVGDGGVYGSTNELVRWERDWHHQWADPDSLLHAMLQGSPMPDGALPTYRFGLEMITWQGTPVVFHNGGLWGFHSLLLRVPERRLSVIQLANCPGAEPDMETILAALL